MSQYPKITAEEAEEIADEYIEEIEDVGYPDDWEIERRAESCCDPLNEWLLFTVKIGDGDDRIEVFYRPQDHKTQIWVHADGDTKQSYWGRGEENLVRISKKYLRDLCKEV